MEHIRPAADLRLNSILLATDFSQASEKALRHTLAIRSPLCSEIQPGACGLDAGIHTCGPDAVNTATEAASRDAHQLVETLAKSGA